MASSSYSSSFPSSRGKTPLSFNSQVPLVLETFLKFVETHRGSLWHCKPQDIRLVKWHVFSVKPLSRRLLRVITGHERDASLQRNVWDATTSDINNTTKTAHKKKFISVFFGQDFAFGAYTQLCNSFGKILINLKGVRRCLFNILLFIYISFLSNYNQMDGLIERMLWALNNRIINFIIVH